jgi:hypothetical protein
LIVYFIYKEASHSTAVLVSEMTELVLINLSLCIIILSYLKLKNFKYKYKHFLDMSYNEVLIIVGLAGIYIFSFYSLIAIFNNGITSKSDLTLLLIQIFSITEATAQSIFIIDHSRKHSNNYKLHHEKPGRSLIILLILVDVCLWLSETFSIKKYDMNVTQLEYYDIIFWSKLFFFSILFLFLFIFIQFYVLKRYC